MRYTVGSLFSGIGGFDLGFERAGFDIAWQCESDEFCRRVLHKHWPDVPYYEDVRRLRVADAATLGSKRPAPRDGQTPAQSEYASRVDCLIGGFPCQDVSDAGKRVGLDGDRSGLWFEFARVIREFRPRVVAIENVAGLFARGFDRVLGDLAAAGFDAEWATLRASDVGAPHRRERIFIVAYTRGGRRGIEDGAPDADRQGQGEVADAIGDGCGGLHGSAGQRTDEPEQRADATRCRTRRGVADSTEPGPQGHLAEGREGRVHGRVARPTGWPARPGEPQHAWEPPRVIPSSRAQSKLGHGVDGVSRGLAGWRRAALGAFGNAIVPAVAEVVAWRVREILTDGEPG